MDPPVDPGGGHLVPDVSHTVTIYSDHDKKSDGMDTDASSKSSGFRKRKSVTRKICRHCNKKKRSKNAETNRDRDSLRDDCNCQDSSIKPESIQIQVPLPPPASAPVSSVQAQLLVTGTDTVSQPTDMFRKQFIPSDCSPYVIHIQKQQESPNDGASIHSMAFGNLLKKLNFKNIVNGSVKRIGRNRVTLSFTKYQDANDFLNDKRLTDNKYKSFIPSFHVIRMGVIKGVPAEWSLDEVKENISVPVGCGDVIKLRRLNYKVMVDGSPVWKPSQSVVLTFDGQVLPKRIFMCYNSLLVDLYVFPTIQCFNCCRFGHTQMQCRSKPRCYKCGQGHTGSSCDIEEDCASCCLCSGLHFAINKRCPEFERQKNIKLTMAQSAISYAEASKLHPSVTKPYADVVMASPPSFQTVINSPSHTQTHTASQSYKKTVFLKPRNIPKPQKGYDSQAHHNLSKDYNMQSASGNGSALLSQPKEQSTKDIILEILKIFSNSNSNMNLEPNIIAQLISLLSKVFNFNNGEQIQSSPVELS